MNSSLFNSNLFSSTLMNPKVMNPNLMNSSLMNSSLCEDARANPFNLGGNANRRGVAGSLIIFKLGLIPFAAADHLNLVHGAGGAAGTFFTAA